jgi:hypothetical protein
MATAMDPLTNRAAHGRLIHFPLPLRPGLMAYLLLPPDITADEAERVARYVRALVVDGEASTSATTSNPTERRTS